MIYDNNHPYTRSMLQSRNTPWLLFLFLAVLFFFIYHDLSNAKQPIDDYNPSPEAAIAVVAEGSLTRRIALFSLGIGATIDIVRNRDMRRWRIDGMLGSLLFGFVVWAFLSLTWAQDLQLTGKRLMSLGILCIAAMAVVRRLSLRQIVLWTLFSTSLFLLIGIVAELVFGRFQPLASGYRFAGTLPPDPQGVNCGLLVLSAVSAAASRKAWRPLLWGFAVVGLSFLILTGSRTALAATLLGLVVFVVAAGSRAAAFAMFCCLTVAFCSFIFTLESGLLPDLRTAIAYQRDDPGGVATFAGRTDIWHDVAYYVRERPFLGYGYGGFWSPTHISLISEEEHWGVPNSHSTYIDYLLTLGIVGLALYVLVLSAGIVRCFRIQRLSTNPAFAFCSAFLVFCLVEGLLESNIGQVSLAMFLLTVVLIWLAFLRPDQLV